MPFPYLGEIRIFAGNFAPDGWAFCEGQLLLKADHESLYNVIGTTYGGDGTTFGLPDLRGRLPLHFGTLSGFGTVFALAQQGGVEAVTLTLQQTPAHSHPFQATTNNADSNSPNNNLLAQPSVMLEYYAATPGSPLSSQAVAAAGGSQPHSNLQAYLCVNFIISLFGVFPQAT